VGLRRETGTWTVRIHETRSIEECRQLLDAAPASFLVVELTRAEVEGLLGFLARIGRDYPWARLAVVAGRELAAAEWLLREAGAVHFVTSPRQLAGLVRTARRHCEAVPRPKMSPAEEILAALPWSRERTNLQGALRNKIGKCG
jgi:DNA-binding NtrC family response regulator